MRIAKEHNKIIVWDTPDFDVEKTLECGQVFRFFRNGERDYNLVAGDRVCRVYNEDGRAIIETPHVDYFYSYFDLDTDYGAICDRLMEFDELKTAVAAGRGIRILRQDVFETIVSFIISANNNIPRIKGIIERLCLHFGRDVGGYNSFVSKEVFGNMTREDFSVLRAGFREDYLFCNRQILSDDNFYQHLASLDTVSAEKELLGLKGIGPKVASCIMLFSLAKFDSYPVDTWIFKANQTKELNTAEKVRAYYLDRYGDLAGFAQQYIFFSKRNLGA